MAESFTGEIDTQGEYVTVESQADGFTFTAGKTYSMQIIKLAYLKISDAEFTINTDQPFEYKAGTDDLYIKTNYNPCVLTILENEEES